MDRLTDWLGQHHIRLDKAQALSGGDINAVFKLWTDRGELVVKCNSASRFPAMFEAEARGLRLLASTHTLRIPEVIAFGEIEDDAFLLLEFLDGGGPATGFWERFGQRLAVLHSNSRDLFGLDHDNYIGSLPQTNQAEETAHAFYLGQRLAPQVELARSNGYTLQDFDRFAGRLPELLPDEPPALVHGDLWSGNYMMTTGGEPALLDPAVAYAPREMDLGMMHLFGGFPGPLFEAYEEMFPLVTGWRDRLPIWQLYYQLVHLNLFGPSYLGGIEQTLQRFV